MKEKNKSSRGFIGFLSVIVSIILLVCSLASVPPGGMAQAALVCAGINMPEGGISFLKNSSNTAGITGDNAISKTIDITQAAANKGEEETEKINSKTIDLKTIPADIATLMAEAKVDFAKQKKDGDIISCTYGKANATDIFQNVFVRNVTDTKKINVEKVLNEPVDMKIKDKSKPTVVIFHTHTTEAFEILDRSWYAQDYNSRTENTNKNIVRVGTEIANQLMAAGYNVIHDKTIHDSSYHGAYDRSRETVNKYMKEYPNIQVLLDVHRDAIQLSNGKKIKPLAVINGKKAAQIMIISGAQEGSIKNFPDWEYNLRFALNLQKNCEDMFPGLMRPVFFCPRDYNMNMNHCSLLVEFGSDANTLDEVTYSGRLFGTALAHMMNGYIV